MRARCIELQAAICEGVKYLERSHCFLQITKVFPKLLKIVRTLRNSLLLFGSEPTSSRKLTLRG